MNTHTLPLLLAVLLGLCARAHAESTWKPGFEAAGAELDVEPAAADAVATVDRFTQAIMTNALDAAAAELDPTLVVLEMGGAEHSKAEYLADHAKHDAEFLQAAQVTLKSRRASVAGDVAWVLSESTIKAVLQTPDPIDSTETMVLRRSAGGWKIVHIHWSSRKAKKAAS